MNREDFDNTCNTRLFINIDAFVTATVEANMSDFPSFEAPQCSAAIDRLIAYTTAGDPNLSMIPH